MEEIKGKVFEHIQVLARPMVLYQRDHPIHWTPVYVGGKVRHLCFTVCIAATRASGGIQDHSIKPN